jgi:hypothetical protein
MRGPAMSRNVAANDPAPHPCPLPARGERGPLTPKCGALWGALYLD